MSLINCKECGNEISDTAKVCPICGYENIEFKKEKINNGINLVKRYSKIIVIIIIVLLICILGFMGYNKKVEKEKIQEEIIANTLDDNEKKVAKVIKKYKSALKNPESMQIFEIRLYNSSNDSCIIIMDSAGQNGFGGNTRDRVAYSINSSGNISYMGDDSEANRKTTKYTSTEDRLEIAIGKVIQEYWKNDANYISFDKDKILRNLDQVD